MTASVALQTPQSELYRFVSQAASTGQRRNTHSVPRMCPLLATKGADA